MHPCLDHLLTLLVLKVGFSPILARSYASFYTGIGTGGALFLLTFMFSIVRLDKRLVNGL